MTPLDALDKLAVDAHKRVARLERMLEQARDDRARVFAQAHEHGRSSGDIARMLPPSVLPHHVSPVIRVGRGLLASAERHRDRRLVTTNDPERGPHA